ncbi:extracellular developmental signal biosynthesis protein FluG [Aspergillus ibericus CBS 121593]|uniref:Glutamine synthetase/guanido kinase n=1 Tax=Aspergillus ibericus CBS 121593 TaxID=1448316 RepID=A0A395GV46_9EURO|nr:glutamine synthetase/guanido kinase [Aspergillus ibericus CBS 121593]RAK99356.1 glutamine synthetase/guanido kinase [Aspergillus ibericus CBS 121593]
MDPLASLRRLVQIHPLIDNHAHNLLAQPAACNYAKYPFEQITSEAQGPALRNAPSSLPLQRAAAQLATLYNCPSADWDRVKAARDLYVERDYDGLIRRCLEGTHSLLLDDLLTDQDIEPFSWHDRFTTAPTRRIVRIEVVAAQVLSSVLSEGYDQSTSDPTILRQYMGQFRQGFLERMAEAIADPVVVGFKSVICYRTGLNVQVADDSDDSILLESFARTISQGSGSSYRVEDKPLNDWLVRQALNQLQSAKESDPSAPNKPLQLHTGLGDNDINLILSNPAYLQDLVARYPKVDFVLLHSSYPYTREAGYLACVYPNVYLDLGEVFPMVSRDAQESIIRESLEIVPTTRLLWSTDGHFFPETFWLANKQFRDALEKVLVDYVLHGDHTIDQARLAAADILFNNSNRLYSLNEKASYDDRLVPAIKALSEPSSPDTFDSFMQKNPDIKYIWMQFIDYTATTRVRMFPVREFAKIARKQRRIGICLATFLMLQDDSVCPEGSTTGQFYMEPDLSSLRRNVGIDSKSATVMTWWRSEEGAQLEGCPRTALQNVATDLKVKHGIEVLCGFEIEVILLKCITNPDTGEEEFVPCVKNHSWSQMTRDTRRMVPLLEEIVEALASVGIDLEQFHAESAPGQFEFVLPPGSPVAAVDTLLKARQVVTCVAEQHGFRATLHPRPYSHAAGSASHAHVSINPATQEESFLAGVLQHFPALMAFTLSGDVSYERVHSGLWAGSEWVAWGTQNRETPIRKISAGHWEIKSLDGLANMYLAMAAFLAAGSLGVQENQPLTIRDCLYDAATLSDADRRALGITTQLPKTLSQSLDHLAADQALRDVLGHTTAENYITVKRAESKKLNAMEAEARRKWLVERY